MTICDDVNTFFLNPTNQPTIPEDGTEVYGDAGLFFSTNGGCNPAQVVTYTKYCGVPSTNADYNASCSNFLTANINSPDIIYSQLTQTTWPSFPYQTIPQFASFITHPTSFVSGSSPSLDPYDVPPIQMTQDGRVTICLQITSTANILYVSVNAAELLPLTTIPITSATATPPNVPDIIAASLATQTGMIFYMDTANKMHSYNPFTKKFTILTTTAAPIAGQRMIANALGTKVLMIRSDNTAVWELDVATATWLPWATNAINVDKMMPILATDITGTQKIVGAKRTSSSIVDLWYTNSATPTFMVQSFTGLGTFLSCAPGIVNNRVPAIYTNAGVWTLYLLTLQPSQSAAVIPLPNAPSSNLLYGIGWDAQGLNWILMGNGGVYYSPRVPVAPTSWTLMANRISNFVEQLSIPIYTTGQRAVFPQWMLTPYAFSLRTLCTNPNALSFFLNTIQGYPVLFDNGQIGIYTNASLTTLFWSSSTSDQSAPTSTLISTNKYIPIQASINPVTISQNGQYALTVSQGIYTLMQNAINAPGAVTWGAADISRQPLLLDTYTDNYCGQMPTDGQVGVFTNTFPDPRCLCVKPLQLVAAMFNLPLLAQNPVQLKEMEAVAPCITTTCTTEAKKQSIIGVYMQTNPACGGQINICTTILNVGTGGAIDASLVQVNNTCGAGSAGGTPCSASCPIGSACGKNNFCTNFCNTNADCGGNQTCQSGLCEQANTSGTALPTWAIALIASLIAVLIISLGVGIYFGRKNAAKKPSPKEINRVGSNQKQNASPVSQMVQKRVGK